MSRIDTLHYINDEDTNWIICDKLQSKINEDKKTISIRMKPNGLFEGNTMILDKKSLKQYIDNLSQLLKEMVNTDG